MFISKMFGNNASLVCPYCGKQYTKTSRNFGMDCEDSCAEKKYNNRSKEEKDNEKIIMNMLKQVAKEKEEENT
jgi:hypothetical protein